MSTSGHGFSEFFHSFCPAHQNPGATCVFLETELSKHLRESSGHMYLSSVWSAMSSQALGPKVEVYSVISGTGCDLFSQADPSSLWRSPCLCFFSVSSFWSPVFLVLRGFFIPGPISLRVKISAVRKDTVHPVWDLHPQQRAADIAVGVLSWEWDTVVSTELQSLASDRIN